ncbi:hypothetical protein BJX61DRAFT_548425 [Aspergillus egyptiacus]|nr:hypothetical protein BJX61DRAFT_548425 [Aspergillus egyptiacus]
MEYPAAIVFGPQTTLPSAEVIFQLRASLLLNPRLYPVRDSIKELPHIWPVLLTHDPTLQKVPGAQALHDLRDWLVNGKFPSVDEIYELPAVFATPFTVILHIAQYLCYTDPKNQGPTHEQVVGYVKDRGGIQGFCTGLLSAVAVATSPDVATLYSQIRVALNLAVGIGGYIDLDCAGNAIRSIAVRSRICTSSSELDDYLLEFPDTYISVLADKCSRTVTGPTNSLHSLSQVLRAKGFAQKQVDLRGRFHYVGHLTAVEALSKPAASNQAFRFSQQRTLLAPVYCNISGKRLFREGMQERVLESILLHRCDWYGAISAAIQDICQEDETTVVQFGLVDCVPTSLLRHSKITLHRVVDIPWSTHPSCMSSTALTRSESLKKTFEPIAIIGMGCKFPGADSPEDFWHILTESFSLCRTMPESRFKTTGLRRSPDNKLKFWGNFINDIDAFDHRFFKKSSREAASMDPQQRLLMEVAYQTLENAEYFTPGNIKAKKDIGCYIGLCETDYNDNVTSHQPNAFSSLGTLRAFITGKISHFFGWTGPSITYDTACSSSAVAIQAACRALQIGECSMALAGGVSLYTSPMFYQNLAAASFLSPTGPSKPFDAKGDGYCRGEGVGLVLLKPLSAALADHDNIMAVIAAAAVNQNENTTALTVPNIKSQTELYSKVISDSGIHPHEVSFVEAHGTGTPVGDPIEFASIRAVFGGRDRATPLAVTSVKGNIGHTEGASGVASLIKTVLMMRHGVIPAQANHSQLNPKIAPLEQDNMVIPLVSQLWKSEFKVACINNYGAAGSNAAMIVCEGPRANVRALQRGGPSISQYPIYLSANSPSSLKAYSAKLVQLIDDQSAGTDASLPGVAFNLANRQNHSLPHALITAVTSMAELREQLSAIEDNKVASLQSALPPFRPVVFLFGGQTSTSIGLSRRVYESSTLLRRHLQECDEILLSLGQKSIFPGIFSTDPIPDVVLLQSALFSLQYACAMSWMDAGLSASALVGHSFGQLTALTVSGVLSLRDGLALVTGRARLMQDNWAAEPGSMVSIQAGIEAVMRMITIIHAEIPDEELEVACFNGPSSHVVVGSAKGIDRLQQLLTTESIRHKRLNVSHGFHSRFTELLLPGLEQCARQLKFDEPGIPIETCSRTASWTEFNEAKIVEHTRTPVYFAEALDRVAARLGPCTWLEAGSGSSVTRMARASLNSSSNHLFQPVQLTGDNALSGLVDSTLNLWKAGHRVQFWPFHRSERASYSSIDLPPYQFEKTRHWIDWIDNVADKADTPAREPHDASDRLLTFVKYLDDRQQHAEFRVNSRHDTYSFFVKGHAVLGQPLCPAGLYVDLACQAARALSSDGTDADPPPSVEDLEIQAPLGVSDRVIVLRLRQSACLASSWSFYFLSKAAETGTDEQLHGTGTITLRPDSSRTSAEFARFRRLVSSNRCEEIMRDPDCQGLQGPVVYDLFKKVVTYADHYKGVQSVYCSGNEATGKVRLSQNVQNHGHQKSLLLDNFIQVTGIRVNCLSDIASKDVYVCTKIDRIQAGPAFTDSAHDKDASWIVYASSESTSGKDVVNDIFVFHAVSGELAMIILGARFTKVLISSLARVLSRANAAADAPADRQLLDRPTVRRKEISTPAVLDATAKRLNQETSVSTLAQNLKQTLSRVIEVPVTEIGDDDELASFGVDSLLGTEVLNEINTTFNIGITPEEFAALTDVASIVNALAASTGTKPDDGPGLVSSGESTSDVIPEGYTPCLSISDDMMSKLVDLVAEHLECEGAITPESNLSDLGLDSILSIELASDIKKMLNCEVDMSKLDMSSTVADLISLALPTSALEDEPAHPMPSTLDVAHVQRAFDRVRLSFDTVAKETGAQGFWKRVKPLQTRLVLAYTVEAFAELGCTLATMRPGERLPALQYHPRHERLVKKLYGILRDGMMIAASESGFVRSDKPVDLTPSSTLLEDLNAKAPQHLAEYKLLDVGSRLAECLKGTVDPADLSHQAGVDVHHLADVYLNGPMYAVIMKVLCRFLQDALSSTSRSGEIQILELGAASGRTTELLLECLEHCGIAFTYTLSDASSPAVDAARMKFVGRREMQYAVIDIETEPDPALGGKFDVVISATGIHATRSLEASMRNIHTMLRPDGFTALVEFTRGMCSFDLVFGLFQHWWRSEDCRNHIIASEDFWHMSMRKAGFQHVSWTDGETVEARTLRVITGFKSPAVEESLIPREDGQDTATALETVLYKQAVMTPLFADIYYPPRISNEKHPIALMIHGGGHVMLSRKDIRPKQTTYLHSLGFLPISIDYRLCPETTLSEGPIRDVCDALAWARTTLPSLPLLCPGLRIDPSRVVIVGWSTGGTLAMTTAFTSIQRGLAPPDAILAFYCPTDYEDPFWTRPNYPENSEELSHIKYNLLEGVRKHTITAYNVPSSAGAVGGWMAPHDPRSRIVLHMNWRGQCLPVLLRGLPAAGAVSSTEATELMTQSQPEPEEIQRVSPYAQIRKGVYRTPTCVIHGTADDLIPWQQSVRTVEALKAQGVQAEVIVPKGKAHLFDLYRDPDRSSWEAVQRGYDFLAAAVSGGS